MLGMGKLGVGAGAVQGTSLSLFSANCFCESPGTWQLPSLGTHGMLGIGRGGLAGQVDKLYHAASQNASSTVWVCSLAFHFRTMAHLPPFSEPQCCSQLIP